MATFAQAPTGTFTLKPTAGITLANITNADGSIKVGFIGGVEGEYQLSNLFSLSGGVLYSMQGTKGEEVYQGTIVDEKVSTAYINVPILANIYVAKGFAIKAGVQPGFLVSSKAVAEAGGNQGSVNVKDATNTIDLSIPVGLSYEYKNVVLDGRYNIGLTNVLKGVGSNKNSVFQITLGYKFAVK